MYGTASRPRLSVYRSLNHLFVQLIDDVNQKTIFGFSTLNKDFRKKVKSTGNVEASTKLAEHFAPEILKKGIKSLAFDRGGFVYHGRIKAFAEALRKTGLEF